ncbi:MAG TPA: hypothetical protein VIQ24_13290 [Pyrinomonadaceae bacterium]
MPAEIPTDTSLFGLFEISDQGIIRYYQPDANENEAGMRADLTGCNLFKDVAPGTLTKELRERILHFRRSGRPTESFDFALSPDRGDLMLRIRLTAIQERTADGNHGSRAGSYP